MHVRREEAEERKEKRERERDRSGERMSIVRRGGTGERVNVHGARSRSRQTQSGLNIEQRGERAKFSQVRARMHI